MKKGMSLILVLLLAFGLAAETIKINQKSFDVNVVSSSEQRVVIEYRFGSFERKAVEIDGQTMFRLGLEKESRTYTVGEPELPKITRSIEIGDDALMVANVVSSNYTEYQMAVAPSRGMISRSVDPATVAYTFSDAYEQDEFYPKSTVTLGKPYIMRDVRGIVVNAYPFAYNPVTQTLRVYHSMTIEIDRIGTDNRNVKVRDHAGINPYFKAIYQGQFINFTSPRYETVEEQGKLLVICYDGFMDAIQPYVDWKKQKGIDVDLVPISEVGSNEEDVLDYIQEYYNQSNLTFVQLVGDSGQIPTFTYVISAWESGGSDPTYSLLEGNDNYPDIFVGRFSAENAAQVETQVQRTIYYERDIVDGEWLHKGTGIASSQGANQGDEGESDYQHIGNLRTQFMDYTYTEVDEIYDNNGGNATMVTNALNEGRGEVMYCGHGSNTTWVSTGFSSSHVNALTNDNKLPFISSVACVNGNFTGLTCFAEAWLRATNGTTGNPTGAVVMYASSVNQEWAPPMESQDEYVNLLTNEEKSTTGGLWYNGSCSMMDDYPTDGTDTFMTWHIFGDATLQVRTDTPSEFTIDHMDELFIGLDTFDVETDVENALVSLTYDGEILGSGYTGANGNVMLDLENVPAQPTDLTLTVTGFNKVAYVSTISLIANEGAYIVIDDFSYNDSGNLSPEYGENALLDLPLYNAGGEDASDVVVTISSDDPYVTISDNSEEAGDIASDQQVTLNNAFAIQIAGNIPDQHEIVFATTASCTNENNEEQQFVVNNSITVNAPAFDFSEMDVFDASGNNNGIIDPGETAALKFTVYNTGHVVAPAGIATLVCNNPWVTIAEGSVETDSIDPDDSFEATFIVTLSEDVPDGTAIPLGLGIISGLYTVRRTYSASVSLMNEDFEEGLDDFGWVFDGAQDWTLDQGSAYEGGYCLMSGPISHNQFTTATIEIDIEDEGDIAFFYRVSSEAGCDFLVFKIDDDQIDSWSGQINWAMVTYPIDAGTHTLSWTYQKDNSLSSGYDKAWIDYIQFPEPSTPIISLSDDEIDFGEVQVNETASLEFTVFNFGDDVLNGNIETYDGFTIQGTQQTRNTKGKKEIQSRESYAFSIVGQGYQEFTLVFMPDHEGDYDGEIVITSNDPFLPETVIDISAIGDGNGVPDAPKLVTQLGGNYPNPFNPETTVAFSLAEESDVSIEIYNIKGQKVKTLVNEKLDKGEYYLVWKGKDNHNKQVGSGVYFYKMRAGRYTATKKMILLK